MGKRSVIQSPDDTQGRGKEVRHARRSLRRLLPGGIFDKDRDSALRQTPSLLRTILDQL
jgi:hypothetical protein